MQLSFAPNDTDYDEDTRKWWHKPENIMSHNTLIADANCANEKEMMHVFYAHWGRIIADFPGIRLMSDCVTFDVAYLWERLRLHVDPLMPPLTMQNGVFVNTFDAGTLEKLAVIKYGQEAIDKIYATTPMKHTHLPLEDAVNTLYMAGGIAVLLGLFL
jgi:hypothetical protein